jgi:hypothetical protein
MRVAAAARAAAVFGEVAVSELCRGGVWRLTMRTERTGSILIWRVQQLQKQALEGINETKFTATHLKLLPGLNYTPPTI